MNEKWIQYAKKADFQSWATVLRVSPLMARLIRNRDVLTLDDARKYLYGTIDDLADPSCMKGIPEAVEIIRTAVKRGERLAISTDYDDDGIFSARILLEGIREIGGTAFIFSPNRTTEGYGINRRIIDGAKEQGCSVLITCDNGISAREEVLYAREQGFTVIVTDHHEIPYDEDFDGNRSYLLPEAHVVVDPKQPGCPYPFKELCGAGVAFRLIQALYRAENVPKDREKELYEYVGIATVTDVVPLRDENRILVKTGLDALRSTDKVPLRALMEVCELEPEAISTYSIGFILGPCFNAISRLGDISLAFEFLENTDPGRARLMAEQIRGINEERKEMTEEGYRKALEYVEREGIAEDKVLLVYLEDVHESVIGIIAGRIKERFSRPSLVFTKAADGNVKGSGRSIPAYNMVEELTRVKDLLLKYGGHKMAAGLALVPENFELLRKTLNRNCALTEEDLWPRVYFDAELSLRYVTPDFIEELKKIEPSGMGNPKPLFAGAHFKVLSAKLVGKNKNVVAMNLTDKSGTKMPAVLFGDVGNVTEPLRNEYGLELPFYFREEAEAPDLAFTYYPAFNEFRGEKRLQIIAVNSCKIH